MQIKGGKKKEINNQIKEMPTKPEHNFIKKYVYIIKKKKKLKMLYEVHSAYTSNIKKFGVPSVHLDGRGLFNNLKTQNKNKLNKYKT